MLGLEFLIIALCSILFALLSANYPKELELEAKNFCIEYNDSSASIKKDYFWFCRISPEVISGQIPILTALFTAVSIVLLYNISSLHTFIFVEIVFMLLLVVAYVDAKTKMIPDALPLIMVFMGLFFTNDIFSIPLSESVFGMFIGYSTMYLVLWLTSIILKKEAMGVGDVKLVAAMATIIGPEQLPNLLLLSSLLAFSVLVLTKKKAPKQQFAFGPYLSIASLYLIIAQAGVF